MSHSNWFSSRRAPASHRITRRRRIFTAPRPRNLRPLQLEALEERQVLSATVVTDLPDYAPGATAHILASEFNVGETVQFQVLHTDGVPNTGGGHEPWLVTDGVMGDFDGDGVIDGDLDGVADGNIHTTWYVNPDDSADATFELTATGLSSGLSASHTFTDSVTFAGTPSVSSSSSSRSSATFSHTVGAGTDRLLLVTVLTLGDEDVSSVSFNGQALTQAVERDGGDDDETAVEIWFLKLGTSASSTTANIVVNFSSSVDPSYIRADNLTGVDQTTPIGATAGTTGDDDDISVNITTTTANSLIYGAVSMYGGDTDPFDTGDSLTQLFDSATGTSTGFFGSPDIGVWGAYRNAAAASTYNFSAEASSSDDWAVGVIEIRMTQAVAENPVINVLKKVNGNDANTAGAGPTLAVGGTATFTYSITNGGNVALSNITLVDDNGTPANGSDNFSPTFTGGDTNSNGLLDLTETWTYSATRTVIAGQYTNIATASGKSPGNTTVTKTDPANYFGSAPALNIQKLINGQDADSATGPVLAAGGTATFTYQVTNTGNIAVGSIAVVDDNGTPGNAADDFNPTFTGGDTNNNGLLDLGETWNYGATRTVVSGQYTNIGQVTGSVAATGQSVNDTDPANYFGSAPGLNIEKLINGQDADSATGPILSAGGTATFTYQVTNTGNIAVGSIVVVDDNGTPANAADDFNPTFTGGDTNSNGRIDIGETWNYSATRTVVAGQYTNIGKVTGAVSATGQNVSDTDPANYFGSAPGLNIEKLINGQDADSATGPILATGGTATFSYQVTNTGNIAVGSIVVVDDNGTPANAADDFNPTFAGGDTNSNGRVDLGETWNYSATRTVVSGQYTNIGKVTGSVPATGQSVSDTDPANYFGAAPALNIEKLVNGLDVDSATGPFIPVGNVATFTYQVTNTGNIAVGSIAVVDDNGTPGNLADDFNPTFTGGDTNSNGLLDLGETWAYSASHTVTVGQYVNIGKVTGSVAATGQSVSDTDPAYHYGKPAPGVQAIATSPINENGVATLTGSYTNIDVKDSHTLTVDWDDPNNATKSVFAIPAIEDAGGLPTLNVGDTFNSADGAVLTIVSINSVTGEAGFSVQHQYLDDGAALGNATASDTSSIAVTVVTDEAQTNSASTALVVNNVAPVAALNAVPDVNENGTATLTGKYTDIGLLDAHTVTVDWADPNNRADSTFAIPAIRNAAGVPTLSVGDTFNSSTDNAVLAITAIDAATGQVSFSVQHTYLDDGVAPGNGSGSDTSTISVTVTDDDAKSGGDTENVLVKNVAPEILTLSIVSPIYETESATLTGTYSDIGTKDTHWLDIDWNGDGFYEQTLAVSGGNFSISNQYNDDNPTGTASDTFNVNVRLRDDDAGFDTASTSLTVNNVAPEILSLSINSPIQVGQTAMLSGTFTDVGPQDTHQLDIDWDGNGTYDQTVAVTGGNFAIAHIYATAGNFNVNARLSDDDTGSDTASVALLVRSRPVIVLGPDKGNTSKPIVKVVNQETGKIVSQFYAYEGKFLGGVQVATGDLTGDGIDEIITSPGQGRVGEVRVFTQQGVELTQFRVQPYGSGYTGGVEVEVGDVNGDGKNDIVTVTKYGRPDVRVFFNHFDTGNPSADAISDTPNKQFYAFASNFRGGADVIVADLGKFHNGVIQDANTPDGKAEIIVGSGSGMRATVNVYDVSATPKIIDTILPFANSFKGGVTLSAARVNGDAIPDLIVAAGNGGGSAVEIYNGLTNDAFDAKLAAFSSFDEQATKHMPVHATAIDTTGDGIADILAVVQGTNGKSNQIRYFNMAGAPQGIHYGFNGPWNIAGLQNSDPTLPLDTQFDVAAKDDVYTLIGATTSKKTAKKK